MSDINITIPHTDLISDRTTSKGTKKIFKLESGYYFILKGGKFADGDTDIEIVKELPE